jgi:putative hydrolase of the HAD superfamily
VTLEAVLFDLGGTLIDYHDPQADDPRQPFRRITLLGYRALLDRLAADGVDCPPWETMLRLFEGHMRETVRADREEMRGVGVEAPMRAALADAGIPLDDAAWRSACGAFYDVIAEVVSPRQGITETLTALDARGLHLGIISNTYWADEMHDDHLRQAGLLDLLPTRFYSARMPYRKPHPSIFEAALAAIDVPAEAAAYVGDRPDVDVAAAQAVGMHGILIRSKYRGEGLMGVEPDAIIDEIPDLLEVIPQLEKAAP